MQDINSCRVLKFHRLQVSALLDNQEALFGALLHSTRIPKVEHGISPARDHNADGCTSTALNVALVQHITPVMQMPDTYARQQQVRRHQIPIQYQTL